MGRAVFPPCYLTWDQTMVNVMKIMVTSFKRSHAQHFCTQCLQPCSRPLPSQTSAGDSWTLIGKSGSVSCWVTAPFSWVLVLPSFVCVCVCLPRVCFQSCVSSGSSMVGLMAASSKRAYAIPRSTAPRAPAPVTVRCWPIPLQETLKHSSVSVSLGSLGPGAHNVCLSPLSVSGKYGAWFYTLFHPSNHLAGASLCPWMWGISSKLLQHCIATAPLSLHHSTKGKGRKKSCLGLHCTQLGARQWDPDTASISLFHNVASVIGPRSQGEEIAQDTYCQYQAGWVMSSQQQTPGSACLLWAK